MFKRAPPWHVRALLSGTVLFVALCLGEWGARLLVPDALMPAGASAPEEVQRRAGARRDDVFGSFTYDGDGFRIGSGLPYDRSVLFIGDSFTEGCGVSDQDTFPRATERALRRHGLATRTFNAGERGFGPAQQLQVLRRVLARIPMDAVVVQSFPMNDVSDNLAYGGFGIEDGILVEYPQPMPPVRARVIASINRTFLRDLHLVRLLAATMFVGLGPAPYDAATGLDLELALLVAIRDTARRHGIPAVGLVVPTQLVQQVQRGGHPGSRAQQEELQRFEKVRHWFETAGIRWLDAGVTIPDLAADAAKGDGGHFSKDGNERIGEAIALELLPLLQTPDRDLR